MIIGKVANDFTTRLVSDRGHVLAVRDIYTTTESGSTMDDLLSKRVGIETVPNRDMRIFHVNTELFSSTARGRSYTSQYDSKNKLGNKNRQFVNDLLAMKGVKVVGLDKYEISVEVGSVYLWKELQDKIIDQILQRIGWKKGETSIMSMHDFLCYAESRDKATVPADMVA